MPSPACRLLISHLSHPVVLLGYCVRGGPEGLTAVQKKRHWAIEAGVFARIELNRTRGKLDGG